MAPEKKNPHAVALGRLGGQVSSEKKAAAVRENGKLGGRPRKPGSKPRRPRKDIRHGRHEGSAR